MNHVITTINAEPWIEPSRPPVLKSCLVPTELLGFVGQNSPKEQQLSKDAKVLIYSLESSYSNNCHESSDRDWSTFPKQALVFTCLQYKSFENTVGKGEIARKEQFLLFPVSVFYP